MPVAQRSLVDGGRGALRINALFHFRVSEICYSRHIYTHSEKHRSAVEEPQRRGSSVASYQRNDSNFWLSVHRGELDPHGRAEESAGLKRAADCLWRCCTLVML